MIILSTIRKTNFTIMKKVLITDYVHDALIEGLESLGYEVEYDQHFSADKLPSKLPDLSGIVINSKIKMTQERIALAPHLQFIARLGSGLEIIDLEAAKAQNVKVYNSPEGNRNAVAEHAIGMLLNLSNKILKGDREVRNKTWRREQNRGFELAGKTIGIVGMGNTGQSLAKKLSGWALRVVFYDPYVLTIPNELNYIEQVSLEELQKIADIISLHVQLTPETNQLVDELFLSNCKKGAVLINTSRGRVVNTKDLIKFLENGHLYGACLDVFENEKTQTYSSEENSMYEKLYAMNNVVLTPHVAGWTHESLYKIANVLLEKIKTDL